MDEEKRLTPDILDQMAAYIGIQEKKYDTVVIQDANSPEPHKLYCFPVEDALRMIEMLGIVPVDGKILLVDGKQGWGDVVKAIRKSQQEREAAIRMESGRWNLPHDDAFDGLTLCPRCHGAETRDGALCLVCQREVQADND